MTEDIKKLSVLLMEFIFNFQILKNNSLEIA